MSQQRIVVVRPESSLKINVMRVVIRIVIHRRVIDAIIGSNSALQGRATRASTSLTLPTLNIVEVVRLPVVAKSDAQVPVLETVGLDVKRGACLPLLIS